MYCPADFLFFDIQLLCYYMNLRSSLICCLGIYIWGYIYHSLGIFPSSPIFFVSFVTVPELLCGKFLELL